MTQEQGRTPEPSQPLEPNTDAQPTQDETRAAFASEHEEQVARQRAMDAEIEAAGESGNIGPDGQPHFQKMIPKDGVDASGDHNPDDFEYVCGTDGQEWPCEQAQEIEQRQAGGQPGAAAEAGTPSSTEQRAANGPRPAQP